MKGKIALAAIIVLAFLAGISFAAVADGEACSPAGPNTVDCSTYLGNSGFCRTVVALGLDGKELPPVKVCNCIKAGEHCSSADHCCTRLGCDLNLECTDLKEKGKACNPIFNNCKDNDGQGGLFCNPETKMCQKKRNEGGTCKANRYCQPGSVCAPPGKCMAVPLADGKKCTMTIYYNPNENQCEPDSYCNPEKGKEDFNLGICTPRKDPTADPYDKVEDPATAYDAVITPGMQCIMDAECKTGTYCWRLGRAFATCTEAKTGAAPGVPKDPGYGQKRCYRHDDCYSGVCDDSGFCKPFVPKSEGDVCAHPRECMSENCKAGKCVKGEHGDKCYYLQEAEGLESFSCKKGLTCKKPGSKLDVRGTCFDFDEGSNPATRVSVDPAAPPRENNPFNAIVAVTNNGRNDTKGAVDVEFEFVNSSGQPVDCGGSFCIEDGGRVSKVDYATATNPIKPQQADVKTIVVHCPGTFGFYTLRARITTTPEDLGASARYKQSSSSSSRLVTCSAQNPAAATGWRDTVFASLLFNIGLVALIYMASKMFSSQLLGAKFDEEASALAVTVVVGLLLFGGMADIDKVVSKATCDMMRLGTGGSGPCTGNERAADYAMAKVGEYSNYLERVMGTTTSIINEIGVESSKNRYCNMFGVGVSVPGCAAWGVARGPMAQLANAAGFGLMDQFTKDLLLQTQNWLALGFLVPLGIFLRAFRFSRQAGSTLIALGLALYLVLPVSLLVSYKIADEFEQNSPYYAKLKLTGGFARPNLSCDYENPSEDKLKALINGLNSPGAADSLLFAIIVRGLFATVVSLAITFGAVRVIGELLGTEINVYQIARFS